LRTHLGCPAQYGPSTIEFLCPAMAACTMRAPGRPCKDRLPGHLPSIAAKVVKGQIRALNRRRDHPDVTKAPLDTCLLWPRNKYQFKS